MGEMLSGYKDIILTYIVFIIFSCLINVGLIIGNANEFHNIAIERIQSSYFSESVINECKEDATKNGFILSVEDMTIYEERKDMKVSLTYSIKIPIVDVETTKTKVGYAR